MHRAGSVALSHFPRDSGYLCVSYDENSRSVSMQGDLIAVVKIALGNIAKGPLAWWPLRLPPPSYMGSNPPAGQVVGSALNLHSL